MKKYVYSLLLGLLLVFPNVVKADTFFCGFGTGPCSQAPIQGNFLFNSQVTSGATSAVSVTLAAGGAGIRSHVYEVTGRCTTAAATTAGLSITDGGTTVWSTGALDLTAERNYVSRWSPGLTGATNSAIVITLAACSAGVGILSVQADRY